MFQETYNYVFYHNFLKCLLCLNNDENKHFLTQTILVELGEPCETGALKVRNVETAHGIVNWRKLLLKIIENAKQVSDRSKKFHTKFYSKQVLLL